MAQYDDLNVKRIALVGVISVVVTAVTALAVQVVFYAMASYNDTRKQAESDYRRQNKVLADQAAQIASVGVDPDTGNITIPVQEAMKMVIAEDDSESDTSESSETTDET